MRRNTEQRPGPATAAAVVARPAGTDDPITTAALFVATQPGVIERIQSEHLPDRDGRGCVVCSRSPHGPRTWPCALAAIAQRATEITASAMLANPSSATK